MAYRNYGPANGFIVDPNGFGDFTTIAAALTAAPSGTTIFLKPGTTYTENPVLKANVNISAWECDSSSNPSAIVIINGKITMTVAGTATISGVLLQTNSDYLLSITGSAASIVNLISCTLNCSNNTGLNLASSSGSSQIALFNCKGNLATTGIAYWAISGAGNITIQNCDLENTGGSSTASTISSGGVSMQFTKFVSAITTSSTGIIQIINSELTPPGASNFTVLTHGGSSTNCFVFNSNLSSGTASAVSISSTLSMYNCVIGSTNTNAITGAGTLNSACLTFSNTSSGVNVTTYSSKAFPVNQGGSGVTSYTAYELITAGTTTTGAVQQVTDNATNQLLASGGGSALPAFTAYPQISGLGIGASPGSTAGLTFDGSNFLNAYSIGTYSPTFIGGSTPGSTVYGARNGYYTKIGNLVTLQAVVTISSNSTFTGDVNLGALPFTIKNQTNGNAEGPLFFTSTAMTWPASTTYGIVQGQPNTTFLFCPFFKTAASASSNLQVVNTSANCQYSITYQV